MDFTGFPLCTNGDTLIVLSPKHTLQLHSDILKRRSTFFKEHISQENSATLSSSVRHSDKETVRWRFDLLDKPELDKECAGKLVLVVSCYSLIHRIVFKTVEFSMLVWVRSAHTFYPETQLFC